MGYEIIRIDEFDSAKNSKFLRTNEASQSQRIGTIPESISSKIKILDAIINNDVDKFSFLLYGDNYEPKKHEKSTKKIIIESNHNSNLPPSNSASNVNTPLVGSNCNSNNIPLNLQLESNSSILNYFQTDTTKERNIFKTIENDIHNIYNKKKNLIMIVDSFTNFDDDKNFLSSINNRIPNTKCPIIIVTNNLNFAKNENFLSIKSIFNNFTFYQTNLHINQMKNTILLTTIVLFLHCIFWEKFQEIWNFFTEPQKKYNITSIILEKLQGIFNQQKLTELEDSDYFNKITELSYKLNFIFEYDLDTILYFIYEILKKQEHYNYKEKINSLLTKVNELNGIISDHNELDLLAKEAEEDSYKDYMLGRVNKASSKKYLKYYYDVNQLNNKILKDSSIPKKEAPLNKNNEQLVNLENSIFYQNFIDLRCNFQTQEFYHKTEWLIQTLQSENKLFLRSLLNKTFSLGNTTILDYRNLFYVLNNMDYEDFISFFGIRKPRSTRKIVKDKDSQGSKEDSRNSTLLKLFGKGITQKLLDRFFLLMEFDYLYMKVNDQLFFTGINAKYFTMNKIIDDIGNI